jgi:hypothetical protein
LTRSEEKFSLESSEYQTKLVEEWSFEKKKKEKRKQLTKKNRVKERKESEREEDKLSEMIDEINEINEMTEMTEMTEIRWAEIKRSRCIEYSQTWSRRLMRPWWIKLGRQRDEINDACWWEEWKRRRSWEKSDDHNKERGT